MKKVLLIACFLICSKGWTQVNDEIHERCKDVADYAGCVQVYTGSVAATVNVNEARLKEALRLLPSRLTNTVLRDFTSAIQPFTDALAIAVNDSSPVKRKYLGVSIADASIKQAREQHSLENVEGITVIEIFPNSTAEEAGIQIGDVIISLDNKPITTILDLLDTVQLKKVKERIEITLLRNNEIKNITALMKETKIPLSETLLVNQSKQIEGALSVARFAWQNYIEESVTSLRVQHCGKLNQTVEYFNSWMQGVAVFYPCKKNRGRISIRLESIMLRIIGEAAITTAEGKALRFPPFKTAAQFIEENKKSKKRK